MGSDPLDWLQSQTRSVAAQHSGINAVLDKSMNESLSFSYGPSLSALRCRGVSLAKGVPSGSHAHLLVVQMQTIAPSIYGSYCSYCASY